MSAESVKQVMPDIPITVFSDELIESPYINECVIVDPATDPAEYPIKYLTETPYSRTIYLDSDTYISEPIFELFEVLDSFDMGIVMDPIHSNISNDTSDTPACFPMFNTGLIAFRECERIMDLFKQWLANFREYDSKTDQKAFRNAVYDSGVQFVTLGPEYNCLYGAYPGYLNGSVKVFHGRLVDTTGFKGLRKKYAPSKTRKVLNSTSQPRVYTHGNGIRVHTDSKCLKFIHLIRNWGIKDSLNELASYIRK